MRTFNKLDRYTIRLLAGLVVTVVIAAVSLAFAASNVHAYL